MWYCRLFIKKLYEEQLVMLPSGAYFGVHGHIRVAFDTFSVFFFAHGHLTAGFVTITAVFH
jgi:hypothetical protein